MKGGANKPPKTSGDYGSFAKLSAQVKAIAKSAAEPYRKEVGPIIDWGVQNGMWGLPWSQTPIGRLQSAKSLEDTRSAAMDLMGFGSIAKVARPGIISGAVGGAPKMAKSIIDPEIEKAAVEKYNELLETPAEQYYRWAADEGGHNYQTITKKEALDIYGDESEFPQDLAAILREHGSAVEIGGHNHVEYFAPHEAPSLDEHIYQVVRNSGGTFPAESLAGLDYSQPLRVYDAFRHIAESEGWDVVGRDSKYFRLEKESENGPIQVGIRIADHNNTSRVGHAIYGKADVHLNIAPETDGGQTGYHTIEDAIKKLRTATTNEDGDIFFDGKPAYKY